MPILRGESSGGGRLDVKRADRSVWLVKVPTFVKKAWDAAVEKDPVASQTGAAGPTIGTLCLTFDPTAQAGTLPHATMHLNPAENSSIPTDYDLTFQADVPAMHVFSRDDYAAGKMAVEGKVEYKLDVKPISMNDEAYNNLSRRRIVEANKKTRVVQTLSDRKARLATMRPLPVTSNGSKGFLSGRGGQRTEERRARMEKEALQDKIFKLFEKQSYWTFKQLLAETNQPAVWLKEVLMDVCRFHKRGPNADKWEVKPEYKHAGNPAPEAKPFGEVGEEEQGAAKKVKLEH
uniref:Transcription initiation factor IIF subunit beta n=1 Tax=Pyramimonas obovata TaxID=1411642 RepID=A0A7S0RWQ1_9CHLO|mmetsp:Transcript_7139/g.14469  ORF Transcript_7139/g.14469 Transcript_7139/m.14469 type:complete len:290 (+) Transcript_7139:379-1248(+)|eukprot:CAMPEP_0118940138 /NCGR_PEP_ID=MMETSP1169-20130426/30677_1 /TAXON_ID=36882 /ORGANISM="Pyramimonas obovata, Strain CCMP722" /LENGTH=289 /DNA_ID=CAMNT_0006884547 /DNA_START=316 /DNA_END=1185 /DNA_ORIENTATION=-